MARTKRRVSEVEKEYRKERRRIQRAIRRMERNQYFINDIKPVLPPIPKKITAGSVRRLKKISAEQLYKRAVYLDTETGEITPANVRRREVRQQAARKAAETRRMRQSIQRELEETTARQRPDYSRYPSAARIIIANFRADVMSAFPGSAAPIIIQWLDELLRLYSEEDVAQMLQDAADDGLVLDYKVAYNNELLLGTIAKFMEYLEGASVGVRQDIVDALEQEEDWELPE